MIFAAARTHSPRPRRTSGCSGLARFLPALALPVFWGTASETAGELAGPEKAGKAVANVYLGISGAMVLGIPLGTLASDRVRLARDVLGIVGTVAADGSAVASS